MAGPNWVVNVPFTLDQNLGSTIPMIVDIPNENSYNEYKIIVKNNYRDLSTKLGGFIFETY